MTNITIVGAGLSGLLAGVMLRHHSPTILEAAPELPHNHTALLRFRSPIVGDVTSIPFRKVRVLKAVEAWKGPAADTLSYSWKVTRSLRTDRSFTIKSEMVERYIAPDNLVNLLAERAPPIRYNEKWDQRLLNGEPTISTMPMYHLMRLLNYPSRHDHSFNFRTGYNVRATLSPSDAYLSVYVPNPQYMFSRVSITGDQLIIELTDENLDQYDEAQLEEFADEIIDQALQILGFNDDWSIEVKETKLHKQEYAKISPVPDKWRKDFMHWATDKHNIYSLGRFATWRPGLLLDDLVQDIRLIERWITGGNYDAVKHR